MVRIAGGDTFDGVDHHQRYIGGFQMLARHHHRELLRHQLGLTLAPNAAVSMKR